MKIKTKLFLGFSILLVIMFTLAGLGISRLSSTDESIKEVYDNRYKKLKISTQMRNEAAELSKATVNLLLIDDPSSDKKHLEQMRALSGSLRSGMEKADAIFDENQERAIVEDMLKYGTAYLDHVNQVIILHRQGKEDEANKLRTASGLELQDIFIESMTGMSKFQQEAMDKAIETVHADNQESFKWTGSLTIVGLLLGFGIMYALMRSLTRGIGTLTGMISNFAGVQWGEATYRVPVTTSDEFGQIGRMFNRLADDLEKAAVNERELNRMNEDLLWLQTQVGNIYYSLQESGKVEELAEGFISRLATTVGAHGGAFYIVEPSSSGYMKEKKLVLSGAYAHAQPEAAAAAELPLGQGLVGQAAKDGKAIHIREYAGDYGTVRSAFGAMEPMAVTVQPIKYEDNVLAVFELVSFKPYSELELKLMEQVSEVIGMLLNALQGRLRNEELLRIHQALTDELQSQSEELISQQDELKASNEKLEEQTKALQASEELLQRQQGELELSNEALQRKTAELEEQIRETEEVNRQIELARDSLEQQALELALASKYKSEFLANMSHELRTPLNSLLILSQLLKENKDRNLSGKQVEYAETIYSSGCDLLKLIDDVLDLAKVESGRMELHPEHVTIHDIVDSVEKAFLPLARTKDLTFEVRMEGEIPDRIETDAVRLQQILKNLLSNAFKFTHRGGVTLTVRPVQTYAALPASPEQTKASRTLLAFDVEDTGIGISPEKQHMIFEAFQQADGTTSRQYGGTGLGLSISRQLASLLGGAIELESEEGRGSRFTLYVPTDPGCRSSADEVAPAIAAAGDAAGAGALQAYTVMSTAVDSGLRTSVVAAGDYAPNALTDDRERIAAGDRVLLIIEDDAHFASILLDMARSRGFKAIVALQGDTGLQLAKKHIPDAILLDIQLPVIDGWAVLVQLKCDAATRHIPVHVISVVDEIHQGLSMGAIAWLRKPSGKEQLEQAFASIQTFLNRDLRSLLIVQSDEARRSGLIELIAHDDVNIATASDEAGALQLLSTHSFDCMVIDYGLADLPLYDLLDRIKADERLRRIPIILYTGHTLDKKEQMRLKKYAESIIIKDVKSPERLLDETALFLHRVEERLPEEKQRVLQKLHSIEAVFAGKKVLIVDDDIRNVFALSNLLEGLEMQVAFAETGKQALAQLERERDFDVVLMDVMMPEMDGYEAMRAIRADERFEGLPIIALTAKAMKDDRDKCMQAGASDYITKPVHTEQLLSLIRVWLCK
ncbi:response regulator [Paenibacillus sp. tmac-D7]|uniref:response regulator n=1 Tax=Paenibacillus sp. tmac-D7 TaxID=2591462 RepID=UPI00114353BE|nr:response regulator [Paenibacillus sp. tmac-D7]